MAVRQRAGSANPTPANPTPAPQAVTEWPAAWGSEVELFTGHDLTEKKELVGIPFLILGAEIERNDNRQYDIAYVYAMDANGTEFEFSDTSSTGILPQIQALLNERGLNPAPGGGFQKFPKGIVCMRGLRVSEFDFTDEETGKKRKASVFYLSASGVPVSEKK
jgi:hypothetical protein